MRKSRKSKDKIDNALIIIVLLALMWSLYSIFKSDMNSVEKQIAKCKKECYPNQVIEPLSRKHCVCQEPPEIEENDEY